MYRFMLKQCQEKNDTEVEKVATIFFFVSTRARSRSQFVMRVEYGHQQTCANILPRVRKNSGTQTAAKDSEQAEERSEDGKQNHVARALVSVRGAEQKGRADDARGDGASCPSGELTLQIA